MGGSNLTPYDVVQLIGESPAYDVVVNNIGAGPDPARQQRATRMVDHTADIAKNLGKPVALVISDITPEDPGQFEATQELRHHCIERGFAIFPNMAAPPAPSNAWWTTTSGGKRKKRRGDQPSSSFP